MKLSFNEIRFSNWQINLADWSIISLKGNDAITFIHGQTTNDIKVLQNAEAILTVRLNHQAKVQAFFYVANASKTAVELYVFVPTILKDVLVNDLSKFIIMEDVEFVDTNLNLFFVHTPKEDIDEGIKAKFAGVNGYFSFTPRNNLNTLSHTDLEVLMKLNGFPRWNIDLDNSSFVNETMLNNLGVSYKKGCFLGQETAAKIENNRGPALFPHILKIIDSKILNPVGPIFINEEKIGHAFAETVVDNNHYLHVKLNRESRILNRSLKFKLNEQVLEGIVLDYPLYKNASKKELALELFDEAVSEFNKGNIFIAIDLIKESIGIFPTSDNLEIMGVMLGRLERFEEAIAYMDQLTALDPSSVMAHTNKSLFLMRLGKIEAAEEEKSLATIKSFEKFGEEAKIKKQLAEEKRKKEEELISREKMFLQVLEIDPEDAIANFGMGDISLLRGKVIDAINFLKQAIASNPNYSMAYLLLGKAYEALLDQEAAKETYENGIVIATKKGDMMPANEMQARLNKL